MVLKGSNIFLESPRREDIPAIKAIWTDPATMREVGGSIDWPLERYERWFEEMTGSAADLYFLVRDLSGNCVGEVSYHGFDRAAGSARFNVKILSSCRGRGYGKEAVLLMLDHFFSGRGGLVMDDDIAPDNFGAQKLFTALGFERLPERTDVFYARMTKERFYRLHGEAVKALRGR